MRGRMELDGGSSTQSQANKKKKAGQTKARLSL